MNAVDHELLHKIGTRKPCVLKRVEVDGFGLELRQCRGSDPYHPMYWLVFWIIREPERIAIVPLGDNPADAIDAFADKVEFHYRMARG